MARPVDAEALEKKISEWLGQPGNGDYYSGYDAALCAVQDLIADTPTLTPPNEWVSVEEKLPKEKQRVIVRCEHVGTSVGWILWGNWMADIGPDAGKVTHWMPLPAPPDRRPPEGERGKRNGGQRFTAPARGI